MPDALRFDRVIVVDWSASARPSPARPSSDAIWIGSAGPEGEDAAYFRTRHQAETALTARILADHAAGLRVLVGFDFALGYPAGFARRLTGNGAARSVWEWMAGHVADGPDNANNRFALAADMNRRVGGGTGGPFWGRPRGLDLPDLPDCKRVDYAALALAERRAVDLAVPSAQPVWKLYTTGAVGGQVIMGLPMIHRLSALPETAVWPFDPTEPARIVLTEIYPSLLRDAVARSGGIKDEAQVRLLSRALWRLSTQGHLPRFAEDLPGAAVEEGWVLGAGHGPMLTAAV